MTLLILRNGASLTGDPFAARTLLAQRAASTTSLSFGRIAKPLRGGGGAVPTTSPIAPQAGFSLAGGGMSNPLARVQNEEAG